MILVPLFVSLTVAFALITMAVSDSLLFGCLPATPIDRTLPRPRARLISADMELPADSEMFMVP